MTDRPNITTSDTARLTCLECGARSDNHARGWRAVMGGGFEGEPVEVGVYCPDCAEREFGLD